ncbi:MAG: hypothetical protein ACREYF_18010 [Gammaproteobacteria bacterium]
MNSIKALAAFVSEVMGMRKGIGVSALFLTAAVVLSLGAAAPAVSAAEFSEAELYFELNHSAGDLGIHASIDGGPYTRLQIEDPNGRTILLTTASGRLARQGLTQYFFESAEPSFDELPPETFFSRFPEGEYEIEAKGLAGEKFEATVELSHVLAAPVGNITANGEAGENCDAPSLPSVMEPIFIDWDPVTTSHPDIGESGPIEIARYQFFVEQGDLKFAFDLPPDPDATEFLVPSEIFALGDKTLPFKFEIIARTATGNNTAIENCFMVE